MHAGALDPYDAAMADLERPGRSLHVLWHGPGGPARDLLRALGPDPADLRGPLAWYPGDGPGRWTTAVDLDRVDAGTLLVPSLVPLQPGTEAFALRLRWIGGEADLAPIRFEDSAGSLAPWPRATVGTVGRDGASAEAGLDCLETLDALHGVRLELDVLVPQGPPRLDLVVSARPRRLPVRDAGPTAPPLDVPALSQRERDPARADDACSPVSVAMVLRRLGLEPDLEAFVRTSEHPQHERLLGLWPWNLARAWDAGAAGVVRTFASARDAAHVLRAGHPIVASLRYGEGELPGAPMPATKGHLVVLRGLGDDTVAVNDPAAPTTAAVPTAYDREPFLRAWLADRGVGYVFWRREDRP
jgi:hypothetical protein